MRHPLNAGYRITTNFSSAHPGTDYAPPTPGQTGVPCYAPERSVVTRSAYKASPEGHYVMLQGLETGKHYYFGHFAERRVSVGQTIAEGTIIGILGKTGAATGIHTHVEVRNTLTAAFSGKHNPEAFFKANITGDKPMNPQEEARAYQIVLQRQMEHGGSGRTGYKFVLDAEAELNAQRNAVRQEIINLQTALTNEKNKPPKEVIKEVEKIVEKIVEVEKPVDEKKVVESWLVRLWNSLFNKGQK